MKQKISLGVARRIALAAQGFADPRPSGVADRRHLSRVLSRTGLFQIDSVSAVVRAHGDAGPHLRFVNVELDEPHKDNVMAWRPGEPIPRVAFVVVLRRDTGAVFEARVDLALAAETGFGERLTMFWSNHFCIGATKSNIGRIMAGVYEREAIRPHVFGRFEDMLIAAESHPAMLDFLDNRQSIGPNSPAGRRRGRGLNENLAREIMELHTLGISGGYSQGDVTNLARILTGWTMAGRDGRLGFPGSFVFNPGLHEPGATPLLGRPYDQPDLAQGVAALTDLAHHPATAHFIATKLVRHFVADDPPPKLVDLLASTFRQSGGDLPAVYRALIGSDEAWRAPATKLRSPQEFLFASYRATGLQPNFGQILGPLQAMGQPFWQPSGPNGYADTNAAWASAEGIKTRIDVAAGWGRQRANAVTDPNGLAADVIGPLLSSETRQTVARAESRPQAIALLLMSPEFQRR